MGHRIPEQLTCGVVQCQANAEYWQRGSDKEGKLQTWEMEGRDEQSRQGINGDRLWWNPCGTFLGVTFYKTAARYF